uniref:Mediator of RNA polymerase II transcription subunit 7 n=1 Tax=Panagrellus redivivus TaxID=6233 RepID=A0A7E4VMB6_PANRE
MGQHTDNSEYLGWQTETAAEANHKWNLAAKPYVPQSQTSPPRLPSSPDSPTPTNTSDYFSQGSIGTGTGIGSNFSSVMSAYNRTPTTTITALRDVDALMQAPMPVSTSAFGPVGDGGCDSSNGCGLPPPPPRLIDQPATVFPPVRRAPMEHQDVRSTLSQRLDKFTRDFLNVYPYPEPGPIINMGQAILDGTYHDRLIYPEEHANMPALIGEKCPWEIRDHREMPSMLDIWEPLGEQQSPTAELLRCHPEAIVEFCRNRLFK